MRPSGSGGSRSRPRSLTGRRSEGRVTFVGPPADQGSDTTTFIVEVLYEAMFDIYTILVLRFHACLRALMCFVIKIPRKSRF